MLRTAAACFVMSALPAISAPEVATDIGPVEALVARVMDGVGTPAQALVPPGADPHALALKPSQARALQNADVVFWIGEEMTPWMEGPLESLAGDARHVSLMAVEGTVLLDVREGIGGHDHGHGDHDDHGDEEEAHDDHEHDEHEHGHDDHAEKESDEHAHDEHAEHGHDEHDDHDDHDDHAEEAHHHEGHDPHVWLNPENGMLWLGVIADVLSDIDPENAAAYRANAEAGAEEIGEAVVDIIARINGSEVTYALAHDAFQYFEDRFALSPVAALSNSDAVAPGPARVSEVQDAIREAGLQCMIAEPGQGTGLVETVLEGTGAKVVEISPVDASGGYVGLLNAVADAFVDCAQP